MRVLRVQCMLRISWHRACPRAASRPLLPIAGADRSSGDYMRSVGGYESGMGIQERWEELWARDEPSRAPPALGLSGVSGALTRVPDHWSYL